MKTKNTKNVIGKTAPGAIGEPKVEWIENFKKGFEGVSAEVEKLPANAHRATISKKLGDLYLGASQAMFSLATAVRSTAGLTA